MASKIENWIALNGICPYFTMFPLSFPLNILLARADHSTDSVFDPFCGRGTTNFAARVVGIESAGVDSSPVAVAIAAGKVVSPPPSAIVAAADRILKGAEATDVPEGEFWEWAFDQDVLRKLCILREALVVDSRSSARRALRAIVLGALHGPVQKTVQSHFSNQCPRTFAPKPRYAVKYWRERKLRAPKVDVLGLIESRARRYYSVSHFASGAIELADSRKEDAFRGFGSQRFSWVITSPPYYGMRTYIPDQWLRNWFVGGDASVDYSADTQLSHAGEDEFVADLNKVWRNAAQICTENATLVARFGGISDRKAKPKELITKSLRDSGWKISTIKQAGTANEGRRQATRLMNCNSTPMIEYDVWARRS